MHHSNTLDQGGLDWHKSSYSAGENGNCIEVGTTPAGRVPVRDTKDNRKGPVLTFDALAWVGFVGVVKAGQFSA